MTCTPLGINTHRILLTGERIYPTPAKDLAAAGKRPDVPHFPWWAVGLAAGLIVIGAVPVALGLRGGAGQGAGAGQGPCRAGGAAPPDLGGADADLDG